MLKLFVSGFRHQSIFLVCEKNLAGKSKNLVSATSQRTAESDQRSGDGFREKRGMTEFGMKRAERNLMDATLSKESQTEMWDRLPGSSTA